MAIDLKRALKDKAYLNSLSKEELKECLEQVAGSQTLTDEELKQVAGGVRCDDHTSRLVTASGLCSGC